MARPRKAQVEGAMQASVDKAFQVFPDPVPGDNGAALKRIVAYFMVKHPEEWEQLRLCPLKHGLDSMIERLKG